MTEVPVNAVSAAKEPVLSESRQMVLPRRSESPPPDETAELSVEEVQIRAETVTLVLREILRGPSGSDRGRR